MPELLGQWHCTARDGKRVLVVTVNALPTDAERLRDQKQENGFNSLVSARQAEDTCFFCDYELKDTDTYQCPKCGWKVG